jgi:hypothetical protein
MAQLRYERDRPVHLLIAVCLIEIDPHKKWQKNGKEKAGNAHPCLHTIQENDVLDRNTMVRRRQWESVGIGADAAVPETDTTVSASPIPSDRIKARAEPSYARQDIILGWFLVVAIPTVACYAIGGPSMNSLSGACVDCSVLRIKEFPGFTVTCPDISLRSSTVLLAIQRGDPTWHPSMSATGGTSYVSLSNAIRLLDGPTFNAGPSHETTQLRLLAAPPNGDADGNIAQLVTAADGDRICMETRIDTFHLRFHDSDASVPCANRHAIVYVLAVVGGTHPLESFVGLLENRTATKESLLPCSVREAPATLVRYLSALDPAVPVNGWTCHGETRCARRIPGRLAVIRFWTGE